MFELGAVFAPDDASVLPRETTRVGIALAGPRDAWLERPEEVDFYDLKGLVEELCERATGAAPRFVPCAEAPAWAHPRAAAEVWLGEVRVGTMGLLHPDVVTRADLGRPALVAELDAAALGVTLRTPQAKAPPRFPAVRRDVALCVRRAVPAADLVAALSALAGPFCTSVALFDRYVGKELPEGTHSLAFTLTFRADDRSLQDAEVDAFAAAAVQGAGERFDAQRR
jgi:phenylalanyl-tRNA synthetase beta chain